MKLKKLFIVFIGCCFHGICFAGNEYGYKGSINVLYNDIKVFRKSPDAAPVIGQGGEDFSLRIGCLGMDDCVERIPNLYKVLSSKMLINKACEQPIYASIEINFSAFIYGGERPDEKYKIDYSGKCLLFNGQYFKLKKSVFEFFYEKPISNW